MYLKRFSGKRRFKKFDFLFEKVSEKNRWNRKRDIQTERQTDREGETARQKDRLIERERDRVKSINWFWIRNN